MKGFLLIVLLSIFSLSVAAQENELTLVDNGFRTSKPKKEWRWKPSGEVSFSSESSLPNGVPIQDSNTTVSVRFINTSEKQTTWLETKTSQATKRSDNSYLYSFAVGTTRKVGGFELSTEAEVGYTRSFNYGRAGGKIAKTFGNENLSVQPFSGVDFYFPIDNFGRRYEPEKVKTGVAWISGVESVVSGKQFQIANQTQIIVDSGSIIAGRRNILTTEFEIGFNARKICFGPRIGYMKVWSPRPSALQNGLYGGFFMRYN